MLRSVCGSYAGYLWALLCKGFDVLRFEHLEEGVQEQSSVDTRAKYKQVTILIFLGLSQWVA